MLDMSCFIIAMLSTSISAQFKVYMYIFVEKKNNNTINNRLVLFRHIIGVRQGYPLSAMIFIITAFYNCYKHSALTYVFKLLCNVICKINYLL